MTLALELLAAPTLPEAFEVEVTDEDILLAVCGNGDRCAIARAVRRYFHLRGIWLGVEGVCIRQFLPSIVGPYSYQHDAAHFISDFDRGLAVEPRVVRFTRHHTEDTAPG